MNQSKISICIPTYNRSKYLERLLKNIISQNNNEIEVVIVNDGSKDNTREIVNFYKDKININYYEQENGGRSNALKKSIQIARGKYTLIMDDEDLFKDNVFDIIIEQLSLIENNSLKSKREIIGLVYLTEDVNRKLIGNKFPESPFLSNLVSINADYNSTGDKKQIVKTIALQEVLYDTYPNERRMSTYILWSRLAKSYDAIFINKAIVIKEYLTEGLSKNIHKVRINSPMSSKLIYKELLEHDGTIYKSIIYRIKNAINFYRFNFHSKNIIHPKTNFFYKSIGFLFGYLFYIFDKIKFKV